MRTITCAMRFCGTPEVMMTAYAYLALPDCSCDTTE
jgi:hypothetical protein